MNSHRIRMCGKVETLANPVSSCAAPGVLPVSGAGPRPRQRADGRHALVAALPAMKHPTQTQRRILAIVDGSARSHQRTVDTSTGAGAFEQAKAAELQNQLARALETAR